MTHAADLPAWAAFPIAILLLLGAGLTLTGTLGLLRLASFYERIHASTLGSTLGIGCILMASMIFFSVLQMRLVLHELLIVALTVVTTPVTLILLVRAALYRDRSEGASGVPPRVPPPAGPLGSRLRSGAAHDSCTSESPKASLLKTPNAIVLPDPCDPRITVRE